MSAAPLSPPADPPYTYQPPKGRDIRGSIPQCTGVPAIGAIKGETNTVEDGEMGDSCSPPLPKDMRITGVACQISEYQHPSDWCRGFSIEPGLCPYAITIRVIEQRWEDKKRICWIVRNHTERREFTFWVWGR